MNFIMQINVVADPLAGGNWWLLILVLFIGLTFAWYANASIFGEGAAWICTLLAIVFIVGILFIVPPPQNSKSLHYLKDSDRLMEACDDIEGQDASLQVNVSPDGSITCKVSPVEVTDTPDKKPQPTPRASSTTPSTSPPAGISSKEKGLNEMLSRLRNQS